MRGACGGRFSPLAGTIFQDTHLPLPEWLLAIWHIASQKHGVSALELQRVMGWGSYRTAWICLAKLRHVIEQLLWNAEPLHGEVEVDEAYVGPRKPGRRGLGAHGRHLVVIGIERDATRKGIGRVRLRAVDSPSSENLAAAVESFAAAGSVLITDGWAGYNRLAKRGYRIQAADSPGAIGEELPPSTRTVVEALNRWLMGTLQGSVGSAHLNSYLAEFAFRFNRRDWPNPGHVFHVLLRHAARTAPVRAKDIFKGSDSP